MEKKRILCLDLDGTIRRSKSGKTFIEGPDDIELIPGVKDLVWKYYSDGWFVVGITNQGGIAHGFKTEEQVAEESNATAILLRGDANEYPIHRMLACPEDAKGKVEPYNWRSLCRKPDYGMLVMVEHHLNKRDKYPDWDNSLFVGDRPEDEECARSAGVPFMWAHDFLKQPI